MTLFLCRTGVPRRLLVGHGTAWTVLVAALSGEPPDLDRWRSLAMPNLLILEAELRGFGV